MIIDLAVIYTNQLDECRDFYAGLGLDLVPEQHGNGPAHYAAVLAGGSVLELYPATNRPATGHLRLGLTAPAAGAPLPAGRHTLTDPDGRTVVLTIPEENSMTTEQSARAAVRSVLGDDAQAEVTVFPAGNLSLTVTCGRHVATIDGDDATAWGWSVDPGTDDGFTGHEETAESLEEALIAVRGKIEA
ncbi:VOC family protein [Streptomyces sp. NPDC048248]|uniref:VOC family protein n=1 Tax=Streptomyces sp. NPDC048248 TaxID=3365523 RepID=UPI0037103373